MTQRTRVIQFRVSDSEMDVLKSAAKARGVPISALFRDFIGGLVGEPEPEETFEQVVARGIYENGKNDRDRKVRELVKQGMTATNEALKQMAPKVASEAKIQVDCALRTRLAPVCAGCGHPRHKHGGFGNSCQADTCRCSMFEEAQ